ncbi:BUD23 [Candida jiufengensis]|uniref:BUD23 n=1 Tax=Candida jiufengensis TaxID=497108 RepID=UPI0022256EEB|nr:BUD23 [Candida jiufengensis]KAI5956414.1 BUD23 [Candida jiufengensis]
MSRPEELAPPEVFYNDTESFKYTSSTRVQHIQAKMTLRALELLNLDSDEPHFILDLGCGSGLSGEILTEEGYNWIGMDISPSMLATGLDRDVEGDLFLADLGNGIPFRAGTFDAAISISAIQWLCNADTSNVDPKKRLLLFFNTLYASLKRGGKFVAQFYPSNDTQIENIMSSAKVAGFGGGLVIDEPESKKNKKYYLVLTAGITERNINLKGAEMDAPEEIGNKRKKRKLMESRKEFINRKKETMRRRGRIVAEDSKFTALPTVYEPLPPRRNGESAMKYIHKQLLEKHDPTGKRRELINYSKGLRAGDIIKVTYLDRSDVTGRIIAIKRGQLNLGSNILLRTKLNRVGSEIRIPVYNPNIRNIEVLYKPKEYMPRAAHYYIRESRRDVDDVEAFVRRQHGGDKKKK